MAKASFWTPKSIPFCDGFFCADVSPVGLHETLRPWQSAGRQKHPHWCCVRRLSVIGYFSGVRNSLPSSQAIHSNHAHPVCANMMEVKIGT